MNDYRMADDTDQYRTPRREPISGRVVLHDSASMLDRIAPDTGAENVTRFMEDDDKPHSYHEIGDTDSEILLLPDDVEAFGALGGVNRDAWHICIACNPDDLDIDDPASVTLIDWMARRCVAFWQRHGFDPLGARWLSADDGRVFGVLHHGDLQGDRSDAWSRHPQREQLDDLFMARVAHHAGAPSPTPEVDDVAFAMAINGEGRIERFSINGDGEIVGSWQRVDGQLNYAPWTLLTGSPLLVTMVSVAVVTDTDGTLIVNGLTAFGETWQIRQTAGKLGGFAWGIWTKIP